MENADLRTVFKPCYPTTPGTLLSQVDQQNLYPCWSCFATRDRKIAGLQLVRMIRNRKHSGQSRYYRNLWSLRNSPGLFLWILRNALNRLLALAKPVRDAMVATESLVSFNNSVTFSIRIRMISCWMERCSVFWNALRKPLEVSVVCDATCSAERELLL